MQYIGFLRLTHCYICSNQYYTEFTASLYTVQLEITILHGNIYCEVRQKLHLLKAPKS